MEPGHGPRNEIRRGIWRSMVEKYYGTEDADQVRFRTLDEAAVARMKVDMETDARWRWMQMWVFRLLLLGVVGYLAVFVKVFLFPDMGSMWFYQLALDPPVCDAAGNCIGTPGAIGAFLCLVIPLVGATLAFWLVSVFGGGDSDA